MKSIINRWPNFIYYSCEYVVVLKLLSFYINSHFNLMFYLLYNRQKQIYDSKDPNSYTYNPYIRKSICM